MLLLCGVLISWEKFKSVLITLVHKSGGYVSVIFLKIYFFLSYCIFVMIKCDVGHTECIRCLWLCLKPQWTLYPDSVVGHDRRLLNVHIVNAGTWTILIRDTIFNTPILCSCNVNCNDLAWGILCTAALLESWWKFLWIHSDSCYVVIQMRQFLS